MQTEAEDLSFCTIRESAQSVFRDRNSRFLAYAFPVENEEDIQDCMIKLKKQYHDARHFCYAYILGHDKSKWRANDDGEPAGSAGLPIYNQCLSFNLTNILVVVVRYFGGTKLGVPGLINAYKTSTRLALEQCEIIKKFQTEMIDIQFSWNEMNQVMTYVKAENIEILFKEFAQSCKMRLRVPLHKKNELKNYFNSFSVQMNTSTKTD
jgi:uncharacterized YigZ family protein